MNSLSHLVAFEEDFKENLLNTGKKMPGEQRTCFDCLFRCMITRILFAFWKKPAPFDTGFSSMVGARGFETSFAHFMSYGGSSLRPPLSGGRVLFPPFSPSPNLPLMEKADSFHCRLF
jgi:hypothetical protein